jgi:hypothetical protein
MTSGPAPSHVAPSCVQMWPDEWVNPDHRVREYPVTRLRLLIAFRKVRSGVAGVTSGVKQAAKVRWEYGSRFGCPVIQSGHRARFRRHVRLQISTQIRWPALNWLAVASTWISYLTISPGVTGSIESFASL